MQDYRRIADRVAADITAGRLSPGRRLPPQRAFARRHGIAASTAERVYGELVRRGLVVGEVGRGTFVRAAPEAPGGRALAEEATAAPVNLELNYPVADGQADLLAPALTALMHPGALTEALRPAAADGTAEARAAAADLLAVPGWRPDPGQVLFTGNARQAIAAALVSLVPPGGRAGVEELTYPLVKDIAAGLGRTLVPLSTDTLGVRPDAIAAAHRSTPLAALYLQPTLHNPTSVSMSGERREQVAGVITELRIPVIEDRIWSFLRPALPLAAHAPELVHLVDGLSKRVAPGLTAGFLVVPPGRVAGVADAVRAGGWSAGRFALQAAVRWAGDGTVTRLVAAKRAEAARRQQLVRRELAGFTVRADPRACYAWWELPAPWRADTFTAAAAAHGIAVTPGTAFAVASRTTPNTVRLGLASSREPDLLRALRVLAEVARGGPKDRG
ncbi:PLP-dependent aminotransferase family protein [Streptomyces sp. NPDC014006]|uniref:aminotransferase-like domain-containing protein n=1 Tax=Streptomyces sp. NPDC014006 TaxID=3364870 RepID=UPI0036FE41D4